MSEGTLWLDEIMARLEAVKTELPYEERDRHAKKSAAWSDLYQHAPTDLRRLIAEVTRLETELANKETRSMSTVEDFENAPTGATATHETTGIRAMKVDECRWVSESGSYLNDVGMVWRYTLDLKGQDT